MMKFKKRIQMFEDFEATTKVDQKTSNATVKKETTEVTVDAKPSNSDTTRSEIIQDVDNIINNLAELSDRITEEHSTLLEEFEQTANSILEDTEVLNEDFMAEIMKQVTSMKSYAKLSALYPKMKKNILKAELTKKDKLQEFEATKTEKTQVYNDQLKNAYKEKIAAVSSSDLPAIKKSQQKEALRQARDQAIEKGSDTVAKKLEAQKQKLTKQMDDKIRDLNTKLTDLQSNNKIEAELLSKQWQVEKIKHDDQFEFDKINKGLEIDLKYAADNPEQQEKKQKLAKEMAAKVKAEAAEKAKEKAEELKEIQAQFDAEAQKGSEEEKEAKKKITDWFKAGNAYASYLGSIDFGVSESMVAEAEVSDEVKAKIKELRKAFNDANAAVSVSTFKKAGSSETEAEEQFTTFKKMVNGAVEEYQDEVDSIDGIDDEEPKGDTETGDENTGDTDGLSDKQKESLKKAEAGLAKAQEAGDDAKVERYKKLIADIKDTKKFGESLDIDTLLEAIENESNKPTEQITESFGFKTASVADRFRSLM